MRKNNHAFADALLSALITAVDTARREGKWDKYQELRRQLPESIRWQH